MVVAGCTACLFNVARVIEYLDPAGPYRVYLVNAGILTISATAITGNVLFVAFVLRRPQARYHTVTLACAIVSAVVPAVELWYGSTIYYGEVRDKQGLPWSLSNAGPIGSLVFILYALWLALRIRGLMPQGLANASRAG